jgi:hypothetical protein
VVEQALHIKSSYRGSPSSSLGTCGAVGRWVSIEKRQFGRRNKMLRQSREVSKMMFKIFCFPLFLFFRRRGAEVIKL